MIGNKHIFVILNLIMLFCYLNCMVHAEVLPPDKRTWKEVITHLMNADNSNDFCEQDARRLKELDSHMALETFLSLLSKENPAILRLRAIDGIGRCRFKEAIPTIEKIVSDEKEDMIFRIHSLNIGLRYMKNQKAVDIAERYIGHKDKDMRISAHWVLSEHGGDREIKILVKCLKIDRKQKANIIYALSLTKNKKVGYLVFKTVYIKEIHTNVKVANFYSSVMSKYRVAEASKVMLVLFSHKSSQVKENAFRYFVKLPDIVAIPLMIKYLKECKHPIYYNTTEHKEIYNILELEDLTDKQKKQLRGLFDKKIKLFKFTDLCI